MFFLQFNLHSRFLQDGYSLSGKCIVQVRDTLYADGTSTSTYECELDPKDTNGVEGIFLPIEDDGRMELAGIVPGETTISAKNSHIKNGQVALGKQMIMGLSTTTTTSVKVQDKNNRNLATVTGDKSILVVRINALGDSTSTTLSEERFSDSVFSNNADGNGADARSLKTQYAACSHGKLNIIEADGPEIDGIPYQYPEITNGAITIDIAESASEGHGVLRDAATVMLTDIFGKPPRNVADHVMYCLPSNAMSGIIAYAYINSWNSVYSDRWCSYLSTQMHEIGHNINLAHSNEQGTYRDQT